MDEIHSFVDGELKKGYICPLKSPQIALVLFIPKKTGKKCIVMGEE